MKEKRGLTGLGLLSQSFRRLRGECSSTSLVSNGVTGFHQFDVREVPFRPSEYSVEPYFLNGLNCAVVESMKRNEEPLRRDVCCVLDGHRFHGNRVVRLFI